MEKKIHTSLLIQREEMQSPDGRRYEGMNLIASRHDAGGGGQGTVAAQTHPGRLLVGINIIPSHCVWND